MIALELLFADEVYRRVVLIEVVRHRLDGVLDIGGISAVLEHDEALTRVLLPRRELWVCARTDGLESTLNRHSVLLCVLDALDAADGVAVALADALAPERVVLTVRQDRIAVDAREREQARVPADRDDAEVAALLRRLVDVGEVLRDARMRVKAVDDVEVLRVLRRLLRQIRRAAAAEDHDIDLVLPRCHILDIDDRHALRPDLDGRGIAAREDCDELHIRILFDCTLNAAAQIAVTKDTNANAHRNTFLFKLDEILKTFHILVYYASNRAANRTESNGTDSPTGLRGRRQVPYSWRRPCCGPR